MDLAVYVNHVRCQARNGQAEAGSLAPFNSGSLRDRNRGFFWSDPIERCVEQQSPQSFISTNLHSRDSRLRFTAEPADSHYQRLFTPFENYDSYLGCMKTVAV
jgi:hypothetical protein